MDQLHCSLTHSIADSRASSCVTFQLKFRMSYLLHPLLLDEAGLCSAIRWYVEGFAHRSKIRVGLDMPEDIGRLPRDLETALFRIVQECLTTFSATSGAPSLTFACGERPPKLNSRLWTMVKASRPKRRVNWMRPGGHQHGNEFGSWGGQSGIKPARKRRGHCGAGSSSCSRDLHLSRAPEQLSRRQANI